jgi:hypothetical protein
MHSPKCCGLSRIRACRESILDMINFCPPGTPITARRALKNVLQTRRVYQSSGRPFFYSPRCDRALPLAVRAAEPAREEHRNEKSRQSRRPAALTWRIAGDQTGAVVTFRSCAPIRGPGSGARRPAL